jgi:asparagine N-glycosylation enzyme membrane subunit Stt3
MRFVYLESSGFLKGAFERTRPGFRDRHGLFAMFAMLAMFAMMEKVQEHVTGG